MTPKTKTLRILNIFLCLVALDCTILLAVSTKEKNSATAYDFYLSGNHFYLEGKYKGAIPVFQKSVELDPDYYYARVNLGVALARRKDMEQAIRQFTFCINQKCGSDADRFVFYYNRMLAFKEKGDKRSGQRDWLALKKLDSIRAQTLQNSKDYVFMDTLYSQKRNESDKDKLFREHKASIIKGKIIVQRVADYGNKAEEYEAIGLIEGTLREVSGVLTDYKNYPEFMPNVEEIFIRSVTDEGSVVDHKLGLPMGVVKKYRLMFWSKSETGKVQLFWRKLPWSELKPKQTVVDTYGQWILEDFPEKENHVLAYYRVYTHPGKIPFGTGWIVDILTKESIPNIIKGTRNRVKQITR
jgi:tetratricopeptide (TPR) repeat protein